MDTIVLSGAVKLFLFDKSSAGRSLHTVADYRNYLNTFITYLDDPQLHTITGLDINKYLTYMQVEYPLHHAGVPTARRLSPKTIANIQTTLSVFWKWAVVKYKVSNPCEFERIRYVQKPIDPLSEADITAMLSAVDRPANAKRKGQVRYEFERRTKKRDRALIFTLLDTGARASELCDALLKDVDTDTGRIKVTGKGRKTRFVYLGRKGIGVLWAYLLERFPRGKIDPEQHLFLDDDELNPLNRDSLRHVLLRIGRHAGVENPHPHRFRHTFAIQYLRNGGDSFTLQQLLGHTSLDMVMHYVKLAEVDMERVHRKANPSDNWKIR